MFSNEICKITQAFFLSTLIYVCIFRMYDAVIVKNDSISNVSIVFFFLIINYPITYRIIVGNFELEQEWVLYMRTAVI